MTTLTYRFVAMENIVHRALVRHSIAVLRVSIGAVFLGFGFLKFFPGVSPAEGLVMATTDSMFLGLVPGGVALALVAAVECFIGICFLIGTGAVMRVAIWALALQLLGILSPLVLETGRLFAGPSSAPTLEGQYVLKDVILVAAGMVVAAGTFRGGRLVREEPQVDPTTDPEVMSAERKLQIVLSASTGGRPVPEVCRELGISEAAFYDWRDVTLAAAAEALDESPELRGR